MFLRNSLKKKKLWTQIEWQPQVQTFFHKLFSDYRKLTKTSAKTRESLENSVSLVEQCCRNMSSLTSKPTKSTKEITVEYIVPKSPQRKESLAKPIGALTSL